MKYRLIFLLVLTYNLTFGQTNFDKGFQTGYKNGFCYNKAIGCLPPIPPITPIPKIGEDLYSYQDGYNRGFEMGLNKQKEENSSSSSYKTTKTSEVPVDFMYKPNYELMQSVLEAVDKRIDENIKYREALINWVLDLRLKNTDAILKKSINENYEKLVQMEPEKDYVGFSKKQGELDKIKMNLKIAINEYNLRTQNTIIEKPKSEDNFETKMKSYYENKEYAKIIELITPLKNAIDKNTLKDDNGILFYYTHSTICNYELKNWQQAIINATKAIEYSKTINGNLYFIRAISKSNLEDYFGSNTDYDFLINNYERINYKGNSLATLINNKAYNYVKLKQFKEAMPLIDKAISLDKKTDYIWDTKGELEYLLLNYKECINAMNEVIKLKPNSNAYYFRGLAHIKLGQKESGCSDLSTSGQMGNEDAYKQIKLLCK